MTEDCFTGATEEGKYKYTAFHTIFEVCLNKGSDPANPRTLAAQVKAFLATWIKFAALGLKFLE